jgi:hypothetical protein
MGSNFLALAHSPGDLQFVAPTLLCPPGWSYKLVGSEGQHPEQSQSDALSHEWVATQMEVRRERHPQKPAKQNE